MSPFAWDSASFQKVSHSVETLTGRDDVFKMNDLIAGLDLIGKKFCRMNLAQTGPSQPKKLYPIHTQTSSNITTFTEQHKLYKASMTLHIPRENYAGKKKESKIAEGLFVTH